MEQLNGERATVKDSVHTPIHATWKSSLPCVHLQLIPIHIRIFGSEKGEELAKIGTNKPQPAVNMMFTSAKNSDTVVKKPPSPLSTGSAQTYHGNALPCHLTCQGKSMSLKFRLATGHSYCQTHRSIFPMEARQSLCTRKSKESKKISIASFCVLDSMVHDGNTHEWALDEEEKKAVHMNTFWVFTPHSGGLFSCFGGTIDHEDGLFLSISHKPLVNSLKDSRQSLRMKACSQEATPPHSNTSVLMNAVYHSHLSACTSLTAGPNNSHNCNHQIPWAQYNAQPLFPLTQLQLTKTASNLLFNQHIPMYSAHKNGKWSPVSLTCTAHSYVWLTKAVHHAISHADSCQPLNTKICSQASSCRIFARQSGKVTEFSPKYFGFPLAQSSHNAPYSLTHLSLMPHDLSKWLYLSNTSMRHNVNLHSEGAQFESR